MWPDDGEDEDERMEAIAEAYTADAWTMDELRRLLRRGGRWHEPVAARAPAEAPLLLRQFLAECGARGSGAELGEGDCYDLAGQELYEALRVGNGDLWVCGSGDPPEAYLSDHEEGGVLSRPVPLGQLLAAWLFYDEVVARELVDHSDVDLHASELLPVAPATVFQLVSF